MSHRVPPRGQTAVQHEIAKVPHGYDITVHVRRLEGGSVQDELSAEVLVFGYLAEHLAERRYDVRGFLNFWLTRAGL